MWLEYLWAQIPTPTKTEIYLLAFDLPLTANVWIHNIFMAKELKLIEIDVLNVCLCFYSHVPFTYKIIIHFHLTFINFDSIGFGFLLTDSGLASRFQPLLMLPYSNNSGFGNSINFGDTFCCWLIGMWCQKSREHSTSRNDLRKPKTRWKATAFKMKLQFSQTQ